MTPWPPVWQTSRGHLHCNDIREETVEHTQQEDAPSFSNTVSLGIRARTAQYEVWPGWVLIKPDKDLSPVHAATLSGRAGGSVSGGGEGGSGVQHHIHLVLMCWNEKSTCPEEQSKEPADKMDALRSGASVSVPRPSAGLTG